jgi:hypothetical protein
MLLRHEDFVADPPTALRAICQFCGVEADELVESINHDAHFQVGHLVGGNRLRFQGPVRLQRPAEQRQADRLKLRHRLLFAIIAGGVNRYYGYQ